MLAVTDQNFFLLLFIIVLAVESTDYVTQWLHVTLDMLSRLSMACFAHRYNGDNNKTWYVGILGKLDGLMCIKGLKGYIVGTQLLPILSMFTECQLGDQQCWNTENLSVDKCDPCLHRAYKLVRLQKSKWEIPMYCDLC